MNKILYILLLSSASLSYAGSMDNDLSKTLRKEYNAEAKRNTPKKSTESPSSTGTLNTTSKSNGFINCGTGVTVIGIENSRNPYGQGITNPDCARSEHYSPSYFKRKTIQGKNYVKQYDIKKTNTPIKSGYERVRPDYNGIDDKPFTESSQNASDSATFNGLYSFNPPK